MVANSIPRPSLPSSGLSQTSIVFGALLFAFLVYITVKGDLKTWLSYVGL